MDREEYLMYAVNNREQVCCTCDHWTGLRANDEDGFVYSLKNIEGFCSGFKRVVNGTEFNRALTFPDTRCKSWKRWIELDSCVTTVAPLFFGTQ